jgi:phenylacetate-CoA ligase
MYWFGESLSSDGDWRGDDRWQVIPARKRALATTPLEKILVVLDAFSRESFAEALPEIVRESGFAEADAAATLTLLPQLLRRESLEKRLRAEFANPRVLDAFAKLPNASFKVRAVPAGLLLHVTAGNVFLSAIDSLVMGLLTKNLSILKVSGQNRFFPLFFAEKLRAFDRDRVLADKFAVLHWKGGDAATEAFLKKKVDAVLAWGGEEMIAAYQRDLPPGVKLLGFGPKLSLQVITARGLAGKDLAAVARKIVADVIPWDQAACASPQNLYLQEDAPADALLEALDAAFAGAPARGTIDDDEATEILKERYRGLYSELMDGGRVAAGDQHLLHLEANRSPKPSPLHRSLIVKRFRDVAELRGLLEPFSYYLQSCGYLVHEDEKAAFLDELCTTGIKRFAPIGTVTWGMEGAPHDGRFVLRELVNFIGDELRAVDYDEATGPLHDSGTLKAAFARTPHPRGYIFSSGGTTGEPKFVHFSYEEFDYMSDLLAANLRAQGVAPGMTVANLFVAGNLWSSFLCLDKALEKIGAVQLPIGGLCAPENILTYLKKFRPDVVMGIPSMLVATAEFALVWGETLEVPLVFYAGEALSEARQEYLRKVWNTKTFGSAGYASVDAGVIGYQCDRCGPGEHHVFSDLIDLRIVDGEAVVTSLIRDTMPVANYRTGDRVEWIDACACGRPDRRFRLLGRIDNTILIWSCRLPVSDIEQGLATYGVLTYQVQVSEVVEQPSVREVLSIAYEAGHGPVDHEAFLADLYRRLRDVKDTIDFLTFRKNVVVAAVEAVPRNPRTGKVSTIVDRRR